MTSWQTKRLGELATVQTGPFGAQLHEKDYVKVGGTPIITVENLVGGVVKLLPGTPHVSDVDKERLHRYVLREGDIVFSRVGAVDRSAYVTTGSGGWLFSGRLLRVHPGVDLDAKYLNYHFNDEHTKNLVRNLAVGGTMPSLNTDILNFVPIKYPEKPEQERIVSVLEVWDEYIEKLEQKIALKEQLKKGLMQQLLTGKHRLPGFDSEWSEAKLGDLVNVTTGRKDVNQGNPDGKYPFFTCSRKHTYSDEYSFDDEAILIAGNGDVGHCKYYKGKFEAYQRTYVLTGFNKVSARYIYPFLRHYFQNFIDSQKQMGAMPFIKVGMLKDFKVVMPADRDEQDAISSLVAAADSEIRLMSHKLADLKLQKKYLLKNLITGTIRTPETLKPKGVSL